jgi:site-specific recombinase XerC
MKSRHPVRNRAIVALASAGLTVSEIVELQVETSSLRGTEFQFRAEGRLLSVRLVGEAAGAVGDLLELREGSQGPLFRSERGKKLSPQGIRHILWLSSTSRATA